MVVQGVSSEPVSPEFPVFSLFNREMAASAPETGSLQTACTTIQSPDFARR